MKPGRNDPCPCGSGRKYKHCCQSKESGGVRPANAGQLLQAALAHHNTGQLDQAGAVYRQVLQIQPNNPEAHHNLGLLAMQVGQHASGLSYLEKAWKIAPTNERFCLALTDCLLTLDRPSDALRAIDSAVPRKFNSPQARQLLQLARSITSGERPPLSIEREILALFNAGQCSRLEDRLAPLMNQYPNWVRGWEILGVALASQGKNAETALEIKPDYAGALSATGQARATLNVLQTPMQRGRNTPAAQALRQETWAAAMKGTAKREAPTPTEIKQLADLFIAGRHAEMESRARLLVEQYRDSGIAWKALGTALLVQGKDALPALQKASVLLPDDTETHSNLGIALAKLGQFENAAASYRRALEIKPDSAELHNTLGNALQNLGQLDEAVASCRRALEIKRDFAEAHSNLGNALQDLGQLDEAVASYRRALKIKPELAETHYNLGNALQALWQLDNAVASYRRALEIKPDYAKAHNNLGNVLKDQSHPTAAAASYRRALEIKPDLAEAYSNLGLALQDLGQLDEAVASYRRALEIKPDFAEAHSNLLFLQGYHALLDPQEYLSLARGWERAYLPEQDRQAARHRAFQRKPRAGRRLRVGYVSGDYRQHPVSYNMEQLFAHHDRARIELFAYSTHGLRDAVTERLQALVEHWVPVMGISDAAVRDRVDADGIDVLIDLSGHTRHNRLGVFARRAAPVQVYYLGYFASTGLTEMDYLIGDDILTPPETDSHFSERVWRLPRIWECYNKIDTPLPDWRPAQDGGIWLGSFNNLGKLTAATLAIWAKVLHALPEGKLLLKTRELADVGNRQRILDAMHGHGILPDRIELQDRSATPDWRSHMAYYDRLDIGLDPVGGMGGGITSCEALWMGAPIITLVGDRMSSRITATILNAVGRPEWITRSEAEYIDKVVALARDVDGRKLLRSSQRHRMAASPLCDARDLAESLENAYFEMFDRWRAGQNEQIS